MPRLIVDGQTPGTGSGSGGGSITGIMSRMTPFTLPIVSVTSPTEGTKGTFATLDHPDALTTGQRFEFAIPADYHSGDLTLQAAFAMSTAVSADIRVETYAHIAKTSSGTIDTGTYPAVNATVTPPTTTNLDSQVLKTINAADFVVGDVVQFFVSRVGADGADTHTGDWRVLSYTLSYLGSLGTRHVTQVVKLFQDTDESTPAAGLKGTFDTLDFATGVDQEQKFQAHVPLNWDGVNALDLRITYAMATAAAAAVVISTEGEIGEIGSGSLTALAVEDYTLSVPNSTDVTLSTIVRSIPIGVLQAGDQLSVKLKRKGTDGADTHAFALQIISAELRTGEAVGGIIPQVTAPERTAGTETDLRSFAPEDVASMAGTHGGDSNPAQVSGGERTAGTETALRSFSPEDVASMAGTHGGGGGGGGTSFPVVQGAHGLVVGQPVYYNGSIWVVARADDADTTADGLVSAVADAGNFTYTLAGEVTLTTGEWDAVAGTTGGLTAGEHYRLSGDSPGGLITSASPSTLEQTQFLLRALSTTVGLVYVGEPHANPSAISSGGAWEYVKTVELSAPATTIDVTGLNGDVDEKYMFVFNLIHDNAGAGANGKEIYVYPNGDTSNGRMSRIQWQGTTVTGTEDSSQIKMMQMLSHAGANQVQVQGEMFVNAVALAGNYRTFECRISIMQDSNNPRGMQTIGSWDNVVDNLTNVEFDLFLNSFDTGSKIHVYRLKKNTNAPVAVGGLQLIETKVFTVDAATYTFAGLDGDADEEYVLRGSVLHGAAAGAHNIWVQPNGAITNMSGNYGQLAGAVYSGGALSGAAAWWLSVTNQVLPSPCHVDAHIYAKLTGIGPNRNRMYRNEMSIAAPLFVDGTWAETVTNLTSLVLVASSGTIGAGTELRLYKVVK